MKVHISVEPDEERSKFKIQVAGLLDDDGTQILKKTFHKLLKEESQTPFEIDLGEVLYISEDCTRFLCELKNKAEITLIPPRFLTRAMIESIENS